MKTAQHAEVIAPMNEPIRITRRAGDVKPADTGKPGYAFAVRGHAALFNSPSLDLGGFVEYINPGAFDDVMERRPEVHLLWDHDTKWILAGTANDSLKLGVDDLGLRYYARIAPFSYVDDLKLAMQEGLVRGASFAFTVGDHDQDWDIDEERDIVVRTIKRVSQLFDVTITARGAYPAASSKIADEIAASLDRAHLRPAERKAIAARLAECKRLRNSALLDSIHAKASLDTSMEHLDAVRANQRHARLRALSWEAYGEDVIDAALKGEDRDAVEKMNRLLTQVVGR